MGALVGQWDVPEPDELKVYLQSGLDVEHSVSEGNLLFPDRESSFGNALCGTPSPRKDGGILQK